MMNQEEYYIFYNGIGNAVIASKQDKEFIDSIYNKHFEDVYKFNEETKNMLIEKKVTISDTLYKTDSVIYQDLKEMQKIVDNFNSRL